MANQRVVTTRDHKPIRLRWLLLMANQRVVTTVLTKGIATDSKYKGSHNQVA